MGSGVRDSVELVEVTTASNSFVFGSVSGLSSAHGGLAVGTGTN